ncbi:hypothetical protein BDV39DRAFT_211026 [Aspergillus sergii]|uniref:Uncharacterized protein n=1 Tax=Aspergillus sergii TaxID=1034303 RepID=A0A5N6WK31_9EURO|nr:hypothetical protein BDV39DRAFT_211026 [Aspergillus sergii]
MEQTSNNPNPTATPASSTEPPDLDYDFPTIYDAWRPRIFLCKETDELYHKNKDVVNTITNRVDRAGFLSVGCYRISDNQSPHNSRPTVLISVKREHRRDWRPVVEEVKRILAELEISTVHVMIYRDPE